MRRRCDPAGHLRQGLLRRRAEAAGAAAGAAALVLLCTILSCGSGERIPPLTAESRDRSPPASFWYELRGGAFVPTPSAPGYVEIAGSSEVGAEPWTVQERVADIAAVENVVLLAVNGYGIARLQLPAYGPARSAYTYDARTFGGRTITALYPCGSEILLHVYFNEILNTRSRDDLAVRRVSLVSYDPVHDHLVTVSVPFHRDHPDWEAVSAVRTSRDRYLFEWKRTDGKTTEFAYTRFDRPTGGEGEIDRVRFLDGYRLTSMKAAPDALTELLERVVRYVTTRSPDGVSTATHVIIRGLEGLRERYYHQPENYQDAPDVDLVTVPGVETNAGWYALTPDGALFHATGDGGRLGLAWLPRLPDRFSYTGFCLSGGKIVAAWEERLFTHVGAAGIYIGPVEVSR